MAPPTNLCAIQMLANDSKKRSKGLIARIIHSLAHTHSLSLTLPLSLSLSLSLCAPTNPSTDDIKLGFALCNNGQSCTFSNHGFKSQVCNFFSLTMILQLGCTSYHFEVQILSRKRFPFWCCGGKSLSNNICFKEVLWRLVHYGIQPLRWDDCIGSSWVIVEQVLKFSII
jgi:hypothetical protein